MNAIAQPRVVMKATALVKRYGQVVALDGSAMTTRARSAPRPRGAQARSLRSGRAYAGQGRGRRSEGSANGSGPGDAGQRQASRLKCAS